MDGNSGVSSCTTIGQVCDRCRRRKTRCYGEVDACTPCNLAGARCVTSVRLKRNRKRKSFQPSANENSARPTKDASSIKPPRRVTKTDRLPENRGQEGFAPVGQSSHVNGLWRSSSSSQASATWATPPALPQGTLTGRGGEPVIGHMGRLVPNDQGAPIFGGSTTGIHFMTQADQQQQVVQNRTEGFPNAVYSLYLHNKWNLDRRGDTPNLTPLISDLPSDTCSIIELTIDRWTPLYPILHKPSAMEVFRKLIEDPTQGQICDLYQILALLALAHCAPAPLHPHSQPVGAASLATADAYYKISSTVLDKVIEKPCLRTLQGLQIIQLYLQISCRHTVASQIGSIATRLAQSLGLHRHCRRFKFDPLETEMRRRVWWCQYSLDVFSSVYHGMPRLIRDQDVDTDLPVPVDSVQMSREGLALPLPGEESEIDNAISMFKIAAILGETLEKLYTTKHRRGGVSRINNLQADLDQWARRLPPKPTTDSDCSSVENELKVPETDFAAVFLRVLHCITKIHIHRPALSFTTAHPQSSNSLRVCCEASAELISILSKKSHASMMLLYPNGAHMLWQAGLTILFARWKQQPYDSGLINDRGLLVACITTLRSFGGHATGVSEMINSCANVLEDLQHRTFATNELLQYEQWNIWDWPMTSVIDLENNLAAVPLDPSLADLV